MRWAPTAGFDAILTYDRIRDRGQIPPQDPRFNGDDPFENLADKEEPVEYDVDQVGLRVAWDINERVALSSITGWHSGDDLVNQDFDGGAIDGAAIPFAQLHTLRGQEYEVFTQELRLSGGFTDTVDFMAGVYYFDSELEFPAEHKQCVAVAAGCDRPASRYSLCRADARTRAAFQPGA